MVLIIDTETTGLGGYPADRVLEIGIAELDVQTGEVRPVYGAMIRYDDMETFKREYEKEHGPIWVFGNTDLSMDKLLSEGKSPETVLAEVKKIIHGKQLTSYNVPFDFGKFLNHPPWSFDKEYCIISFDIMCLATNTVKAMAEHDMIADKDIQQRLLDKWGKDPDRYVKSLDSYRVLCPDDPAGREGIQTHRAMDDAVMEAYILKSLIG